jgi:hypothetical protein
VAFGNPARTRRAQRLELPAQTDCDQLGSVFSLRSVGSRRNRRELLGRGIENTP